MTAHAATTISSMRDPGAPLDLYRLLEPAGEPELIHREAGEGATILDLGCGTGRITHPLVRLGHRVTGVDFDERMLREIAGAAFACAAGSTTATDGSRRFQSS